MRPAPMRLFRLRASHLAVAAHPRELRDRERRVVVLLEVELQKLFEPGRGGVRRHGVVRGARHRNARAQAAQGP